MSESENSNDTVPPQFDQEESAGTLDPPETLRGTLMKLGPGLIIAGSIVGSGELIATTKTGAQAGIALLWLILVGCLIKVFVQVELGRHAITHGQTTLHSLNQVPGKIGRFNWILWSWFFMMMAGVLQLGGIVAGVGQSMAMAVPITGDYVEAIAIPSEKELKWVVVVRADHDGSKEFYNALSEEHQKRQLLRLDRLEQRIEALGERGATAMTMVKSGEAIVEPTTWDDRIWSLVATLITIALLYSGRYGILQNISTVLVVAFTFVTIGNVCALQSTEQWSLSMDDVVRGFSFQLPDGDNKWKSLATALATFGIIGVGATELITYPYWCIEKGYARFTGKRTDDDAWAKRAKGWMRVMHYDAFLSMVIYTLATMAFFVMGVTVLYREGHDPDGMRMVSTIASAYAPVFGEYTTVLFLSGAVAVLYSTFLVANAGHSRMYTDAMKIYGLIDANDQKAHDRTLSMFCIGLPLTCMAFHWIGVNPVAAVLLSGLMQSIMLPMIGFGALWFRWTATDERLAPNKLWDIMLIVSFVGLLIAGVWGASGKIQGMLEKLFG